MSTTRQAQAIEGLIVALHRMHPTDKNNNPTLSISVRDALLDLDESFSFNITTMFTSIAQQRVRDYLLLLKGKE